MKLVMRRTLAAIAAGAALAASGPAWAQGKVLQFVQNGNLTILDPIWTTAYVTRNHGYMIYDTLFAIDENNAVKPQMVDKYEVSRRQDDLDLHPARRAGMARRQAGHGGGLRRLDQALGRARRRWARSSWTSSTELKAVDAKTFQHDAEGAVRPGARHRSASRRSNVPFMMPKRDRRDRSVQADRQPDRLRPVHLRQRRVQARREARLHQEPQVQAARRARLGPGRRQGRQGRPGRVHRDARPAAAGECADHRRDRPDRAAAARPDPAPEEGQERAAVRLEPARPPVHHPLQHADQAVRQSQDPPGRALLRCARRTTSRRPSASPKYYKVCTAAFVCGTPNAVDDARATCWSSRTSRSRRRCSRRPATTARRSC